jgi:hypothetical protein
MRKDEQAPGRAPALERSRLAASLLTHDQYLFEETHVFVARNEQF